MILDLTTMLTADHPMIAWAKTKENPHIAMGHVGTHLDTYEKQKFPWIISVPAGFCFRSLELQK